MVTTFLNKTNFGNVKKRFRNMKINGNIKIELASSLTLNLAF